MMVANKSSYTVPMTDRLRVKHGTQARFTVVSGRRHLEDKLVAVEHIGGAITVACVTYNAAAMSGGVSWFDPSTGGSVERPHVRVRFRSQDVLTGEQMCDCERCSS